MSRIIGIGVIGMGWMGMTHSRAYRQVGNRFPESGIEPRLVICADEAEARARDAQGRFGFEQVASDWREVIEHPEIEAVDITAPNRVHVELVQAAATAGKHMFCEKPVGRFPEETARAEQAAREAGVLTFTGYNYRWAPLVQYARQLIRDGRLGELTHYRARFFVGYGSNPHSVLSWRFREEEAGLGTLADLMSHVIDMAHMLAGPIRRVVGSRETFIRRRPVAAAGEGTHYTVRTDGPTAEVTNEDYVGALVQFACGAHGTFEVCRVIRGPKTPMAFEVHGTKGALGWNFERMNELELYLPDESPMHDGYTTLYSGPEHPWHGHFNPGAGVGLGYEDTTAIEVYQFLQSIADGKQAEPGFAEALAVAEVQQAIRRSWESKEWEEVGRISPA